MTAILSIRRAIQGDEACLAELGTILHELHRNQRPDVFKPANIEAYELRFAELLETETATIWLALSGTIPAGYALVHEQTTDEDIFKYPRRLLEVEQIVVHPEYRNHGIGKMILQHVKQFALEKGVSHIELNTWCFNETAIRAFQNSGFTMRHVRFECVTDIIRQESA